MRVMTGIKLLSNDRKSWTGYRYPGLGVWTARVEPVRLCRSGYDLFFGRMETIDHMVRGYTQHRAWPKVHPAEWKKVFLAEGLLDGKETGGAFSTVRLVRLLGTLPDDLPIREVRSGSKASVQVYGFTTYLTDTVHRLLDPVEPLLGVAKEV